MRTTSQTTYDQIAADGLLSKRQWTVYAAIFQFGPATQNEIARHLLDAGAIVNKPSVTPRFAELEKLGVIHTTGERTCRETGRDCLTWDVTAVLPVRPPRRKKIRQIVAEVTARCVGLEMQVAALQAKLARWGRPPDEVRRARAKAGQYELFEA